jgi:hypothetical protein
MVPLLVKTSRPDERCEGVDFILQCVQLHRCKVEVQAPNLAFRQLGKPSDDVVAQFVRQSVQDDLVGILHILLQAAAHGVFCVEMISKKHVLCVNRAGACQPPPGSSTSSLGATSDVRTSLHETTRNLRIS